MRDNKRTWFIAIAGLMVLSGIFLWYVWSGSLKVSELPQDKGFLPSASLREPGGAQTQRYQSFQSPFSAGSGGAFGSAPSASLPASLPFETPPRLFTSSPEQKAEPKKYTTPEVFQLQYPDYYLEYLSSLQNEMVESGYLKPESVQTFRTHNDVYLFVRDYINFLAGSGDLVFSSLEEQNKYIDRVLANMMLLNVLEASLLESGRILP